MARKKDYKEIAKRLKKENKELKEVITIALNKPLVKQLSGAVKRIKRGEYITEEAFTKRHNLEIAA